MTMVLRKPLFRNDSFSRNFGRDSRPMLKIPCGRVSTSLDSGRSNYFENSFNAEASSTSSTSSRVAGLVTLSTPSPSATANGNRVDIEFEKFRRLSEEWIRSREIEEAENRVDSLGSRSPSPQRIFTKPYRRLTSQPPTQKSYREVRSPSPERSPERSFKSPGIQRGESPFRSVRSRSPSPLVFSSATKKFVRSNSYEGDSDSNGYSSPSKSSFSSRNSSLPPSPYRRSFSLEGERKYYSLPSRSPSPQRYTPVSSIFKRSNSYENDEKIRSNFRSRSTSPQRLTPASSYYRRQNNTDGRENGYYTPSYNQRNSDNQFLQNTLPDLPKNRMTSPRRFSEEPSPFRRPLATLHEDEVVARRRFSDGIRKRSYDTSDVYSDYQALQRKLSEAGVRKLSDASVVLTADTDSFIIGDRIWVGGTKPGTITYIGETQFAPGEWAGVTLDEPIGKNNGSVGGVRYFQCEPKKGIFSRLTRLSRVPLSDIDLEILAARSSTRGSESPRSTPSKDVAPPTGRKITPTYQSSDLYRKNSQSSESSRKLTPSSSGARSPLHSKSGSPSPSGSIKKGPPPYTGITDLKLGERVVIDSTSGTKYGVLRYLGRAEFAEGIWAGVELDDQTGKNDGSVAGKKYFICRSNYGLFAPVARVRSFAHRSSRPALPPLRRSGSRESIGASSVASSTVSSSLRGTRRPSRTSGSGQGPTTKALQVNGYYGVEDRFY